MLICSIYGHCFSDKFPGHDPGVCLVEIEEGDVKRIVSHEEMKLTSEKTWAMQSFPDRSFFSAIKDFNINPNDIDIWVFPSDGEDSFNPRWATLGSMLKLHPSQDFGTEEGFNNAVKEGRIRLIKHHLSHASLAFYTSQKNDGLVLTVDGGGDSGDFREGALFSVKNGSFVLLDELTRTPGRGYYGSLGRFHNLITECLGFGQDENGKVSGMAGYGKRNSSIEKILRSRFEWQGIWPLFKAVRVHRTPYRPERYSNNSFEWRKVAESVPGNVDLFEELSGFDPFDIAKTSELVLADISIEMNNLIVTKYGSSPVAYAGGLYNNVGLNFSLSNNQLEPPHFSMAPGDSGLATGAALLVANEFTSLRQRNPYIGKDIDLEEVQTLINQYRLTTHPYSKQDIVNSLLEGAVVGIFRGKAELGPRSLGNRSIIGDPRNSELKKRVNGYLKRRDWFMPFAPAILREELSSYTDYENVCSEYMQTAVPMKSTAFDSMPCAVHVDGTSRVQCVDSNLNPWFYDLIKIFGDRTGIYSLLNTSFNRHGISTISSPRQAIEHLLAGCIDELVIGDVIIKTDDNRILSDISMSVDDDHVLINKDRDRFKAMHSSSGI